MNRNTGRQRTTLFMLLAIMLAGVFIFVAYSGLTGQLKDNPLTIIFGVIGLLLAFVILSRLWTPDTDKEAKQKEYDPEALKNIRRSILESVRIRRIEGLTAELQQALGEAEAPVLLNKTLLAAGRRTTLTNGTRLPDDMRMIEVFQDHTHAPILVIGRPGAGKTILLLELTRDLLQLAETGDTAPIPLIFNLSTWQPGVTFEDWLTDQIYPVYGIPKKHGEAIFANDALPTILMLDGLDETGQRYKECLEAIEAYRKEHHTRVVAASRIHEAKDHEEALKDYHTVELLPLTDEQVLEYAENADLDIPLIEQVIRDSDALRGDDQHYEYDLAHTPLFLNLMTTAYAGLSASDIAHGSSPQHRRTNLLDRYVHKMLYRQWGENKNYEPSDVLHWLHWLAGQMKQRDISLFLIEGMQPDWSGDRIKRYRWIVGLSGGLLVGLIGGLSGGLLFGLSGGLLVGLSVGLIGGLLFGLSGGLLGGLEDIKPVENVRWSWRAFGNYYKENWKSVLSGGLLVGLIGGLSGGLLGGLFGGLSVGLSGWLIFGLSGGLLGGLFGGLSVGLDEGFVVTPAPSHSEPNQGIRYSLKNLPRYLLIYMLLFGLSGGLLGGLFGGLSVGLSGWLLVGLIVGLIVGSGRPVMQHIALRWVLTRAGYMPANYAKFLIYASNIAIMRRVGGGFAFIHGLLRDHIAGLSEEDIARLADPGTYPS